MTQSVEGKAKSFFLKGNFAGPLRFASDNGAEKTEYQNHIRKIISNNQEVTLTTGLGLSGKNKIPARLPALITPGLELMKVCQENDIETPQYVIYQAAEFIAKVNNIEYDQAMRMSYRMKGYLEEYVEVFYPDLRKNIHLIFGENTPESINDISSLKNEIKKRYEKDPNIQECMNVLIGYSKKQRNENPFESASNYAAANVFYNGGTEKYPFENRVGEVSSTLILIGGKREKEFFKLTSIFAGETERTVIPLLCQAGENPTYYFKDNEDIDLKEVEEKGFERVNRLSGPLRKDFEILLNHNSAEDKLRYICAETQEVIR